jgi:hypothetical protein
MARLIDFGLKAASRVASFIVEGDTWAQGPSGLSPLHAKGPLIE